MIENPEISLATSGGIVIPENLIPEGLREYTKSPE